MHSDDAMIGRLLSRREMIALLGFSGVTAFVDPLSGHEHIALENAGQIASACVVQPEQTEGPYFVDEKLNRSDIRADPATGAVRPGVPLRLTFNVSQVAAGGACAALGGAVVDVWQCDALGVYSDVRDRSFNTVGQKFLRGHQITGEKGRAQFVTIYPGWYQGRAVHIHFKIRTNASGAGGQDFTSQLYFDEALTDTVHSREPYASKGQGRTKNERDGIFRKGGPQLTLALTEDRDGYAGAFNVALKHA
jgi:protocatechuate 3,4-dioxygenase beta subunit